MALINLPPVPMAPIWDLPLVLKALTRPPFEPLATCPLKELSLKTVFLVGIMLSRRVSEMAVFSVAKELCMFQEDRVMFRLDPSFLPKVNSFFHRAEEVVMPSFCPSSQHPRERDWHTLNIHRALSFYISRTAPFGKSEAVCAI